MQLNGKNLLLNLVKLGIKLGIIQSIQTDGAAMPKVQNTQFLERYLQVLVDVGIAARKGERYVLFPFSFTFTSGEIENSIPEYLTMYDYIASMAHYKAISEHHPNVLMSFGKDADVWDIFLANPFCSSYRSVCTELLNLSTGDKVLDVGCGSISPLYFSKVVAPNGIYRGIENSEKLASLAIKRLKRERYDWASVNIASIEDLFISTQYDSVICTDVLNYLKSPAIALKNMLKALKKRGRLVIFDLFPDLLDFNHRAYEFYNSLNPSFRGFITAERIINILHKLDRTLKIKILGRSFMVIEKGG